MMDSINIIDAFAVFQSSPYHYFQNLKKQTSVCLLENYLSTEKQMPR